MPHHIKQGTHSIYWTHKIRNDSIGETHLLKARIIPVNQIAPILFGFDMMGQFSLKLIMEFCNNFSYDVPKQLILIKGDCQSIHPGFDPQGWQRYLSSNSGETLNEHTNCDCINSCILF